jgi:murein DD-endopeptidase MepM/ murein hydrolase activator NlpD
VTSTLDPKESEQVLVMSGGDGRKSPDYRYSIDWTVGDKDAVHDDDHFYSLPYAPGRSYRVLQGFGSRFSHTGLEEFAIDFDMQVGTAVHAARAGVVARVEESHDKGCWEDGCGRYANFIVVLHSDGTTGEYYHLMHNGAVVEVGDSVSQGELIGFSGNTGHTTMPHLHFAVYRATDWGNTQSIPVRFQAAGGIINRPRRGARYLAQ